MSTQNKTTKKDKKTKQTTKKVAKQVRPRGRNRKVSFSAAADHTEDLAEGARSNIMIIAQLAEDAIQCAPESLITMGYTKNWFKTSGGKIMYWAYIAFINDLVAILGSKIAPVSGRLQYLNSILASYMPKSVPFKTSTLDYSWDNTTNVVYSSAITTRGYSYYMYEPTNVSVGGWLLQDAPAAPPNSDDVYPILSALFVLLARDIEGKRFVEAKFGPEFLKDVSAFAAVSPYFGQGNSISSSTCASVENEVPFKSNILANLTPYEIASGRVSRNFNTASGDSTAAMGFGMVPGFEINNYSTRYPPVYKFLDLDEVVTTAQLWYTSLVEQAINGTPNLFNNTALNFALQPFPYTARQFRIAIRQCVLSMFANSAALTQNIRYSNAPNSFEPFRCGSNAYPPILQEQIVLPITLVENLRMLLMRTYDLTGTKYFNKKNVLCIVPVWGVFKDAPDPNVFGTFFDLEGASVPAFIFQPNLLTDPNIIDGTNSDDQVCDLNQSQYLTSIITDWNERIQYFRQYSVATAPLGGDGNGCLLTMTRFCTYNQPEIDMSSLSGFQKFKLPKEYIQKRKIQRTISGKNLTGAVEEKEVYVPPNASLGTQYTAAFSSVSAITDTVKEMISYFIYPHICLETSNVPTAPQNRTYTLEGNIIDIPNSVGLNSTRNRLTCYAATMVTGTAGSKNDEMASLIAHLNDTGQGGFLANLVTQLAPLIPF